MIRASMIAALALAALGGLAQAADMSRNPPQKTQVCLDVSGQSLPTVCRVPASRLDSREDICQCPEGRLVDVAVCGHGQRPPADGIALDKVRRLAAKDGSLIGDQFNGQPICVAPRNP
jgi:hypothetical protein